LTNLDGLNEVVEEIFDHPDKIAWLDFSCNQLKIIEPILLTHTNLRSLYLQGNQITDVKEVFMPTNLACLILCCCAPDFEAASAARSKVPCNPRQPIRREQKGAFHSH
jgi:hypothetical protein